MRSNLTKTALAVATITIAATAIAGTFVSGNCTWGVATVKGDPVKNKKGTVIDYSLPWSGSAKDWCSNAKIYATVDQKEAKGAIVVFNGPNTSYGHVGIITRTGEMESMNDLDGLGKWTYNRKVSGFPNKKAPLAPACYIHYKESKT